MVFSIENVETLLRTSHISWPILLTNAKMKMQMMKRPMGENIIDESPFNDVIITDTFNLN